MEKTKKFWNFSQKETEEEYLYSYQKMERDRVSREIFVYREGAEDGIERGRQEGIEEIILKLLDADVKIKKISEITDFSKEKIRKFCEKAKQRILYKNFKNQNIDMTKEVDSYWNLSEREIESEYLQMLEKKRKNRLDREKLIRREGFDEGFIKGLHKERENVTLSMLESGVDTQVILDVTHFTKEELEKLKKFEHLRKLMQGKNAVKTTKNF